MEDKFLASLMHAKDVSLIEKVKLYKTHSSKLDSHSKETPSETKQALLAELKNYDFSQHGTTKQIIRFCRELYRAYEFFSREVIVVAKPFMNLETLSLKEACEEIKDWNYCVINLSLDICQSIDWKKLKKERMLKAAKETDTETLWLHLINTQVLTEEDLDMLIFGQKVEKPIITVRQNQIGLGAFQYLSYSSKEYEPSKPFTRYHFNLEHAIYKSTIAFAYKRKLLLWETLKDSIGEAIKDIFWTNKDITEKDILELALKYGNCEIKGLIYENVYEMALSRLKNPANLIKIARILKSKDGWEFISKKMELSKQGAKRILRIAKISGQSSIWQMFFYTNRQQTVAVSHEELMRIGEKSKDLALWSVLLKHIDYSKVSIDWVFKLIKVCALEVVLPMERMGKREYKSTEACNCMEALSSRFDWKSVSYEKRIEALHLHWYCDWQDPIINSLEKVGLKDFLSLNQKFKGTGEKLQSKVLSEA